MDLQLIKLLLVEQAMELHNLYNKQEIRRETVETIARIAWELDTIHNYQVLMRKIQLIINKFGN